MGCKYLSERVALIRLMLNAPEGSEERLSDGEIIRSWTLFDESGNDLPEEELTPETLLAAYKRHQDWGCPDECK